MSGVLPELLDDDGYPTEAALAAIRTWPIKSFDGGDHAALLEYAREAFGGYGYFGVTEDGAKRVYHVSTGGWSGCEDVIQALSQNFLFWSRAWASSRRGGHYTFEFEVKTMTARDDCTIACTATPDCTTCGKPKALRGRDYPAAMGGGRCTWDCPGYDQEPRAGHLLWSEWAEHAASKRPEAKP